MVQRPGFAMTQESSRPMSLRFVPTKKAELVKTYQEWLANWWDIKLISQYIPIKSHQIPLPAGWLPMKSHSNHEKEEKQNAKIP